MTHPRTLIVAEPTSHVAVIEDYVSIGGEAAFSNSVTELVAGQDAVVSHFLVERENLAAFNISTLRLELARGSNVSSHSILLGGGLVRNNVHPVLAGQGAECLINGLFVGAGSQHLDNYMLVEHAQPQCSSRQFYNGILDDRARGVFHGRIVVHKDAQKTDAKQTNRNLLLCDNARLDTKPQLEIYADDVKCTHGATIGQIEEEQLFYLRSRGIEETSARNLLLYAFAAECLDRMADSPAREFVASLIGERLTELARNHQAAAVIAPEELALRKKKRRTGRDWDDNNRPASNSRAASARSFVAIRLRSRYRENPRDFPILAERINGKPLVYLDNGATSQKPQVVLDAIANYYDHLNANIHRGVHTLSVRATEAHDAARQTVKQFVNAADTREIIFVRGATEAINLVAQTYGRVHVGAGDEVLITAMEHHSNIVPWQILCEEKGAHLKVAPIDDRGELLLDEFASLIGRAPKSSPSLTFQTRWER